MDRMSKGLCTDTPKQSRTHQQDTRTAHESLRSQTKGLPVRALNLGALALALFWLCLIVFSLPPDGGDFRQYWQAANCSPCQ
jgi:hypothetical protein